MSATKEEDLAPGGQDSTVGAVGAGSGVVSDPGPVKGVGVPAAGEAGTGAPQAEQEQGLPRASTPRAKQQQGGTPRAEQEQARPEGALAGAQAGASAEEDSDIGPADEDEEGHEGGQGQMVDAHQFPMTGFRGVFLDLIYLLLRHISYNDHVLIRSRGGGRVVRHRPPHHSCPLPPALPPPAHGGAMAAGEPLDQAAAPEPTEPPDEAAAPEPGESADEAAAPQEATQYQHENSDEGAQKAGGEEEKEAEEEKENKNEEQEPKKDLDPAEGRPGQYSFLHSQPNAHSISQHKKQAPGAHFCARGFMMAAVLMSCFSPADKWRTQLETR
ncbi:cancer/testis antigen 47A-like [Trichechus manatus latirostris]|uniref:Cancer/testis antigen 47A-like n=1 Tax=Trichechus manatus latirostris TaxID=127582 RepID=A0A2Y9G060_TRIMA|nr:cancer/testis antigen 47A-like [Trichechus manatus latirostris]